HHALLAHGLGCQAIRAISPQPCSIALVDNFLATVPIMETPEHIKAAKAAFHLVGTNGGIIFPALTGQYSSALLAQLGKQAPDIEAGDLEIIHQPLDALGFNVYSGVYVRAAETSLGYEILPFPKGYPRLHMPWLHIVPNSLYWGIRHVSETLQCPELPILISENGCAAEDKVTDCGEVLDLDRIHYLRQYLQSAHRAISEGYPLRGYFLWSLMDNFEWAYGYDRRFGITYIDYATQQRLPKASFHWYQNCVTTNQIS
ncbi:MAG: family 1 glycosylhydrolase, partial [Leptolyngbya sp. SIO1D8]|nr:family 1 glycosylhydrolase [Leptolyngbya sp. SIO1D8]